MVRLDWAKAHYRLLAHAHQTEVRVFGGDSPEGKHSFFVSTEQEFLDTVERLDTGTTHVGVGVNERRLNGMGDADVTTLRFIPLDLDSREFNSQSRVERCLKDHGIPVAAKVFSGQKGFHYYVPVTPVTDPLQIAQLLRDAKHFFITTHKLPLDPKCFNPSRIFRVWGTRNNGSVVELLESNPEATPLDAAVAFPQAPSEATQVQSQSTKQKVVPSCSFLDAYLHHKTPLLDVPIEGADFNDVFVPNTVAYANAKRLSTARLYDQIKHWQGYDNESIRGWERKRATLEFSYAALRGNVKSNYPDVYNRFFAKETQDHSSNLRYEDFDGSEADYKRRYREAPYFTITNQWTIKARVISYDSPREQVVLGYAYEPIAQTVELVDPDQDQLSHFRFLDEGLYDPKQATALGLKPHPRAVETNLYSATAVSPDNQQWLVFSEEKLDTGDYVLHGTRFDLADKLKAGNVAKIGVKKRVLLLHSYERTEKPLTDFDELYRKLPANPSDLVTWLFTDEELRPRPTYDPGSFLTRLYLAWLFSGRHEQRQLNLCVMGPPGSGKTPQLRCLSQKFDETLTSGTALTIKGLTISFFGDQPKPGAFLKAKRVLFIDEFFKLLNNRQLESYEDLSSLNDVLDSSVLTAESGKHSIKVTPTCRLLTVTNPIHERFSHSRTIGDRMTFQRMCEKLPNDFMGRVLFVIQTKKEHQEVLDRKRIAYHDYVISLSHSDWLACYDFINDQPVLSANYSKIAEITRKVHLPDSLQAVYQKSESRSAALLFDGLVRSRCVSQKLKEFKPVAEDYELFRVTWNEIHSRWLDSRDQVSDPLSLLSEGELNVLKAVQVKGVISMHCFETELGGTAQLRDKLRDLNLLVYHREDKTITPSSDDIDLSQ